MHVHKGKALFHDQFQHNLYCGDHVMQVASTWSVSNRH